MATSRIDLSAGMVAAPPSQIDLSAGMQPAPAAAAPQPAAAPQAASPTDPPQLDHLGRLPGESYLDGIKRRVASLAEGADRGIASAVEGTTGLLLKVPGAQHVPGLQENHDRAAATVAAAPHGNHQQGDVQIGEDLENLLEFMVGDEVVKGAAGAAKQLPTLEKLKHLGDIGKLAEKYPGLGHILGVGARQAAVAGAQTAAHGGTGEDVAHAAEVGLAAGSLGEFAPGGPATRLQQRVEDIRPTTRTIAAQEVPVLASQQVGATRAAESAANIGSEPEYQQRQQEGAARAVGSMAKRATLKVLSDVNKLRKVPEPETDPARLLAQPADQKPFTFSIPGDKPVEEMYTAPKGDQAIRPAGTTEVPNELYRPEALAEQQGELGSTADVTPSRAITGNPTRPVARWQYLEPAAGQSEVSRSGSGTLETADPALARTTLSQLQDLQESPSFAKMSATGKAQVNAAAKVLQEQLDTYDHHARTSPHFEPVDELSALDQTDNFRDAAEHIEASVLPIIDRANELSKGDWSAWREAEKRLLKITRNPGSEEAYQSAKKKLGEIRAKQTAFLDSPAVQTQLSPDELQSFRTSYRMAATARDLHSTLEASTNGLPSEIAARNPKELQRQMKGGTVAYKRLNGLLEERGDDLKELIGQDGVDNLYRIAGLLKTPEKAAGFKRYIDQASMVLRKHGAGIGPIIGGALAGGVGGLLHHSIGGFQGMLAGAAAEASYRRVMNKVATDPAFAEAVAYAVEHGLSVRNTGTLLAAKFGKALPESVSEGLGHIDRASAARMAAPTATAQIIASQRDNQQDGAQ